MGDKGQVPVGCEETEIGMQRTGAVPHRFVHPRAGSGVPTAGVAWVGAANSSTGSRKRIQVPRQ